MSHYRRAGFIGSHLTETLLARGDRVSVVDDESTGTVENLAAVLEHLNFSFVRGTVADSAGAPVWSATWTRSTTWRPPWACN